MFDFLQTAAIEDQIAGALPLFGNLATAFACGLLMSWLYRHTYRGTAYSMTFDRSLVTLTIITAIVIAVIGNNLARAFGLVGAMSIVRFRTAVKDAQDLVFIFFSLAVGLASGVGLHILAIGGTLFVGVGDLRHGPDELRRARSARAGRAAPLRRRSARGARHRPRPGAGALLP